MADRVLVTGISGFVGSHLALALLDRGYAVRGSLRDLGRADKVREALQASSASGAVSALEFVALDLTRDEGWREAAAGCRYLQHVASPFVIDMPADRNELIRPAVEGTRRALAAGLAAGVERIVLTSSFAAIGYGHPRNRMAPFTEADWSATGGPDVTAYTESKTRAELEAWSITEAAGRRHELAVVNPTGILGPLLDNDPGTSNELLVAALRGRFPAVPRLDFNFVDVRDVAALLVKAMENPEAGGQRCLTAAGPLSLKQVAATLREAFPAYANKLPRIELPDWVVRLAANFSPTARAAVTQLGQSKAVDNRRALALLGQPFIPPADSVIATGRSLIERGLV
jgi:dihydroflavonol-4-reductase